MVPPTRHSSRLGNSSHPTSLTNGIKKEDENAGASTTTRTLRGRNGTCQPPPSKVGLPKAASATTSNVRKRILDDRTNKTTSFISTALPSANSKPLLKPPSRKQALSRKATSATDAAPMVLEDVPLNQQQSKTSRLIKPLKRTAAEPLKRPTASTSLVVPKKKANVVVKVPPAQEPAAPKARRNSGRPARAAAAPPIGAELSSAVEERASKKPRTSEPDPLVEKENCKDEQDEKDRAVELVVNRATKKTMSSSVHDEMICLKQGEDGWEDLDEGDEDDPLMVKEYVNEIYHYMRQLELETLPDPDYMSRQNELTWKMRGVLVDWIIEVHSKFRLLPETLYLAINLMDRFLSKRTVALIKFQLVGVTALFLAAKYEEVICPSVSNFLYMTDGGYDNEEILKAETYMLEMLNWDLRYPNPLNFLRRVSKADQYDIQSRTFAKYFMEISVVDYRLVATTPSLLSAASIWLARKLLKRGEWDANLIHYSGYTEQELVPTAQLMVDYILRCGCKGLGMGLEPGFVGVAGYEGGNEHGNLFKKYATRKFFRVSELVRDWAIDLYTFETPTGWEWDRLQEWID